MGLHAGTLQTPGTTRSLQVPDVLGAACLPLTAFNNVTIGSDIGVTKVSLVGGGALGIFGQTLDPKPSTKTPKP